MQTVVFDTNVLLADPNAPLAFGDAEIVIPETVLGELDKLKTSRVDPDLRFRGREVSRLLFDLSENGSLIDGIDLPEGGRLRVASLEDMQIPEGLATRNADDKILAVAAGLLSAGCEDLVLVTNDLNMLLKAQTFGVPVQRHAEGAESSFGKRFIVRPFQRYKVPIGILAASLALFAAIVFLTIYGPPSSQYGSQVPPELRGILSAQQEKALDSMIALERNPTDFEARLALANFYFDLRDQTGDVQFAQQAVKHYTAYLEVKPKDVSARADYAATLFYLGQTDQAIQEVGRVLEIEPDHVQANFNLGIFYWRGRQDLPMAASQFRKVVELTKSGDAHTQLIKQEAAKDLTQIEQEAKATGKPLPEGGTS